MCLPYFNISQAYMKAVKAKLAETNPDRVAGFEKAAGDYAKKIVANFKDYEFVSQSFQLFSPEIETCSPQIITENSPL